MKKRLLIIGAGIEQIRAYEIAHQLGFLTVGTDQNSKAPAFTISDDKIIASTRNPNETWEKVSQYVKKHSIDGVMTLANDVPITVSFIAKKLNLVGISVRSAFLASNKLKMKEKFLKEGIRVPSFKKIKSVGALKKTITEWNYPIVIKPIDNRGGRGVLRITPEVDLTWAFEEALKNSEQRRILIEKFIHGNQLSVEGFMLEKQFYPVAFSDRNYEYLEKFSPHIIENGGTMPSRLSKRILDKVARLMEKAALSLGIREGPVKGDIVVGVRGVPYVIELAARLSGGYFCSHQIPLCTDVDLIKLTILWSLGVRINKDELLPMHKGYAAIRYWFPQNGRLNSIPSIRKISREQSISFAVIHKQPGDNVATVKKHPDRLGCVITFRKTYRKAVEQANKIISKYQPQFKYVDLC